MNLWYVYGVLQIANIFLCVVAGSIAISLFKHSRKREHLRSWKLLMIDLILLAVLFIVGALRSFQIYVSPYLTHVLTSVILAIFIMVLVTQMRISEE